MELEPIHERAIKFLRERMHEIGQDQGGTMISVDGRDYKINELSALAGELHPVEWQRIQRARDQELRGRRT